MLLFQPTLVAGTITNAALTSSPKQKRHLGRDNNPGAMFFCWFGYRCIVLTQIV